MHRDWTIIVDDREKKPLPFPEHLVLADEIGNPCTVRLHTTSQRIHKGDYHLLGYERHCVIERKGSLGEVLNNLNTPAAAKRLEDEMFYLRTHVAHPVLLFEGDFGHLNPTLRDGTPAGAVTYGLLAMLARHRITPLFMSCATLAQRRTFAENTARLLIAGALHLSQPQPQPQVIHAT
jgi:hypothetical protein